MSAENQKTAVDEIEPVHTPSGVSLPGYEILRELGRGGMGVVYLARQLNLKRLVALKVLRSGCHASLKERTRLRTEAEAVARLQHANIVRIYEVGEHDGSPFLALEYIDGPTLEQATRGRPVPVREAAQTIETLARAVHHAHEQGIVHRDLKPGNVLVDSWTPAGVPKIADFGLAKMLHDDSAPAVTETAIGTPSYMAPEQTMGRGSSIGPATDVYALGAILYELLTGLPPFMGDTPWEILDQVRDREPMAPGRLRPGVPRDLETICLKCLQKEPARRYASACDLAEDLRRFLAYEPIQARRSGVVERARKWMRRRPATAAGFALTLVAALFFTALQLRHQSELAAREEQSRLEERLQHAQRLSDARDRFRRFQRQRDKMIFKELQGRLFPGQGPGRDTDAIEAEAKQTLLLVHMSVDVPGSLRLDPLWTDLEKSRVVSACYEILVMLADRGVEPVMGEGGNKRQTRTNRALKLLEHADRLVPGTRTYRLRRARLLAQRGDESGVKRERDKADVVEPASVVDFFFLGQEQYRQGHLDLASRSFQKALLQSPTDFWSRCFLAACHLQQQRPWEAEAELTRAIAQQPAFPWTHVLRGLAREQSGAFADAESDFAAALKLGVDDEARYMVFATRGLVRYRRKLFAEAVADLTQAIALQPVRFDAHVSLARVYQAQKRWVESNVEFGQALRLSPPASVQAECHAECSRNFRCLKRYGEAVKSARAALRCVPAFAEGHLQHAFALLELGKTGEADRAFPEYLTHGGKPGADFYRGRGRAQMQRGEFVAAIDSYTDALKLEPDSPLFAHRGWAYFFADAWQPALRDFDEAVRRSPDSDEALIGRGLCRVMLGKLTEAIADAEAAFAHEIAAPEMMHNIACIFALAAERLEMGQAPDSEVASRRRQKAMDAIDKTLSLVPESERAAFWRDKIRCDRALNSVRSLAAFKQLEQRYLGDAARPTTEKSGREK